MPLPILSMQCNSKLLSIHLKNILCLSNSTMSTENNHDGNTFDKLILNAEILEFTTQHDLPMFVTIDGSLKNEIATVSISLVAPDISHTDVNMEWQENSNNARTLHHNVKNNGNFTRQKMIRKVKQGINQSIANHLDMLTAKWPKEEQLSNYTLELYKRGEEIRKYWAKQSTRHMSSNSTQSLWDTTSSTSWEDDYHSNKSDASSNMTFTYASTDYKKQFDSSMYDCLG